MYVFKVDNRYFCYLLNPKCGCHTWFSFVKNSLSKIPLVQPIFNSSKDVGNYDDYNYAHCNLRGAIEYFKNAKIDLGNVVFFTTIRNPYTRNISAYWYTFDFINKKNKTLDEKIFPNSKTFQEDFDNYVLDPSSHFNNFCPKKFWQTNEENVRPVNVLRLENWAEDMYKFLNSWGIPVDTSILSSTQNNQSVKHAQLSVTGETQEFINNLFHDDFIAGKYEKRQNIT